MQHSLKNYGTLSAIKSGLQFIFNKFGFIIKSVIIFILIPKAISFSTKFIIYNFYLNSADKITNTVLKTMKPIAYVLKAIDKVIGDYLSTGHIFISMVSSVPVYIKSLILSYFLIVWFLSLKKMDISKF